MFSCEIARGLTPSSREARSLDSASAKSIQTIRQSTILAVAIILPPRSTLRVAFEKQVYAHYLPSWAVRCASPRLPPVTIMVRAEGAEPIAPMKTTVYYNTNQLETVMVSKTLDMTLMVV